jgi:photosystem II stability/assembly factor-like uncharacterized protein
MAVGGYSQSPNPSIGVILSTTDGGDTWIADSIPDSSGDFEGVDCPSTTSCFAVGKTDSSVGIIYATIDGGSTWVSQSVPDGALGFDSNISCPSTSTCFVPPATGGAATMLATTDGGTTWTVQTLPSGYSIRAVSCASETVCELVGTDGSGAGILSTVDGGDTWTAQTPPADAVSLYGVACPSPSDCFAVGADGTYYGVILATTNGGFTWTDQATPSDIGQLIGVSCPSDSGCQAVNYPLGGSENTMLATTDGGQVWTSEAFSDGVEVLNGVTCPTTAECFAVGDGNGASDGFISATIDGGSTWTHQYVAPGATGLQGLACISALDCFAGETGGGGSPMLQTTDGGGAWVTLHSPSIPNGIGELYSITCPSSSDCYAVGNRAGGAVNGALILSTTDSGSIWNYQVTPSTTSGINVLTSISCSTTTECTAVGESESYSGVILTTNDGGTAWNPRPMPSDVAELYGVDCPSTLDCYAVGSYDASGDEGVILSSTDGGGDWSTESVTSDATGFNAISCVDDLQCEVVGGNTDEGVIFATADGGSTWTDQSIPPGTGLLSDIDCESAPNCFAVGAGNESPDDGGLVLTASLPSITTSHLAPGTVGVTYSQALIAAGGVGPLSWSIPSGSLPVGLNLNSSTGMITGTPTSASTESLVIDVTDADGSVGASALQITVDQAPTATVASAEPDAVPYGTKVIYSSIVTSAAGVPTGSVTFGVGSTIICSTGELSSGDGSCTSNLLVPGLNAVTATYSGNANFLSSSGTVNVSVSKATTKVRAFSQMRSPYGSSAGYSVTVSSVGGYPTGTVTFMLGSITICTVTTLQLGDGTCSSSKAPAGSHNVIATYSGNSDFLPSSGRTTIVVTKAHTSIGALTSPSSAIQNQAVRYSAKVIGVGTTPNGSVTFRVGAVGMCTAPLSNGTGSCRSSAAPVGSDVVRAEYSGDSNHNGSSVTYRFTVRAHGYILVGGDGGIFTFGSAGFYGSTGDLHLQRPVVGISPTSDHKGYWLVSSDGGSFAFGDAGFYGSIPGLGIAPAGSTGPGPKLNAPIVSMVPSTDNNGYFMVASDGGVFAFGDARFAGSCPSIGGCAGAAVAVMPDATGHGYWLVTATGNVYAFGDAFNYGSPGNRGTVTSAVRSPDGRGYWILFSSGELKAFGDAVNRGGLARGVANGVNPASTVFAAADGGGYWISTADGAVYPFGDVPRDGGMSGQNLNAPIIAGAGW